MIKIVIVDDQTLLRRSIGQLISIDEAFQVVGTAGNGREAVETCRLHKPDVVLMDIEMPEMNGIEALKVIKQKYPLTKVIMLTTFENTNNVVEAILAEADGYIIKDIGCDELITTIKCVQYGLTVIHKSVREIMMQNFSRISDTKTEYKELLSEEEIEMVTLIVNGKSNKDVAAHFNYSEGTVKNKVSRIYEKLGVADRLQLAVYAVENGLD